MPLRTSVGSIALLALLCSAFRCSSESSAADPDEATLPATADGRPVIAVKAAAPGIPLDPRLFGTNVPAWMNPTNLANERVRAVTKSLGATVLRMPGGSWSDAYNWRACEMGDASGCYWTWAAKPTDFLNFARAVGQEAMWTVSINGTSKEAAAVVAFFNGAVADTTVIGVDIRGVDWKRVGDWAALRASHGNPQPLPIKLWEVGNEVYGSKLASGGNGCESWGWEDAWTCDGKAYMTGKGVGRDKHEGFLAIREAMRAVDPSIKVGAVGVPHPKDWTDWGTKVIAKGGANLDFYVIHHYGFYQQPGSAAAILPASRGIWKDVMTTTNAAFDALGPNKRVPVAVTEYNLASFQELDNAQLMTRAANALFMADMIGQMATNGVAMANQWNLANGRAGNGTDYGLIDAGTLRRAPQYFALKMWSGLRGTLIPATSTLNGGTVLGSYAVKGTDGSLSVLLINKSGKPIAARVQLVGITDTMHATVDVLEGESLEGTEMAYNGLTNPADDMSDVPPKKLSDATGYLDHTVPPFSITLLRFTR